jgi:tetratricopeptide (TPR) repeat protein
MLELMLERLPENDPRRMQVLNGLLELCLLTGEVEAAYGHVRELEGLTGHRDQQIRSFDLLALLEESQGNLADAESAMRFCIKQFPEHRMSHRIRLRLYHMLRRQGRTEEALGVFAALVRHTRSLEWSECLAGEMLPENPSAIYQDIQDAEEKTRVLLALRRQVHALAVKTPPRWLLVRERLLYLDAVLAEMAGDGKSVQEGVATYLVGAPFGDYMGEILRMDAVCAENMSLSPAIRATRAHRYLTRFPEGPHSEKMLGILLRAYYEMGLYRENLVVAEAAFVHAMVRSEEDGDQTRQRIPVFHTMRWIAQSNSRLGRFEVAAALFNRCAQRFDILSPDVDFFRDWAEAASAAGQQRETIRRLEVGMRRLPPGPDRELLMDRMLEARYHTQGALAMSAIEQRIDDLRQDGVRMDDKRFARLYELLFDHVLNHEPDRMPELLAEVRAELPEAIWPSQWAMRYLQRELQTDTEGAGKGRAQALRATEAGKPGTAAGAGHFSMCLDYLDTFAELEKRMGELHERGL